MVVDLDLLSLKALHTSGLDNRRGAPTQWQWSRFGPGSRKRRWIGSLPSATFTSHYGSLWHHTSNSFCIDIRISFKMSQLQMVVCTIFQLDHRQIHLFRSSTVSLKSQTTTQVNFYLLFNVVFCRKIAEQNTSCEIQ